MALSKDHYNALQDIVGTQNISDDPALLDSYARLWMADILTPNASLFMPRPEAVLLPANTEEVQAIVKLCNHYKIKFKPNSTGWGAYCSVFNDKAIHLDLRRMDHILEIDEKNMFAVVEPYVIGAQLQAEAMKKGLNTHMIGAGASCSPLAAATSYLGIGPDSIYMGTSGENMLAVEWVMPTGDILRTGSLGSGVGWYCGDGPGLSARGLMRGLRGAMGGMGVYTKVALKLYPWPGPPVMPVEGTVPAYKTNLPSNFKAHTVSFPNWQKFADALYKIYDSGIGYIAHRQFLKWGENIQAAMLKILTDPTKQLIDIVDLLAMPEIQKLTEELRNSFQIILVGMSQRDIEYQEKVLQKILDETEGTDVAAMADPEMQKWVLLYMIKLCFKNLNFVTAGGYKGAFSQVGSPDFVANSYVLPAMELKEKYEKTGLIAQTGPDALMGALGNPGGGGNLSLEQFIFYDPHVPESVNAIRNLKEEATKIGRKIGVGAGLEALLDLAAATREQRQKWLSGASHSGAFFWQGKIKKVFDPNDTGTSTYTYAEAK